MASRNPQPLSPTSFAADDDEIVCMLPSVVAILAHSIDTPTVLMPSTSCTPSKPPTLWSMFCRLKNHFPVLKHCAPYLSFDVQVEMVLACVLLHNFIAADGDDGDDFIASQKNSNNDGITDVDDDDEPDDVHAWKDFRYKIEGAMKSYALTEKHCVLAGISGMVRDHEKQCFLASEDILRSVHEWIDPLLLDDIFFVCGPEKVVGRWQCEKRDRLQVNQDNLFMMSMTVMGLVRVVHSQHSCHKRRGSSRYRFSFSPVESRPHVVVNDDLPRPTTDAMKQKNEDEEIVDALMELDLAMDELVTACDAFANRPDALLALPLQAQRQWVRHITNLRLYVLPLAYSLDALQHVGRGQTTWPFARNGEMERFK
ncbi:hypothetical protein ACLOJK_015878 [Asimina triloba]